MTESSAAQNNLRTSVRHMGNEAWYFQKGLIRDDDIWLASYPRSGSHFVRFILVSARHFLRYGHFPQDLSGMKTIPDLHGGRLEFATDPPRIIKTHFPYDSRYRRTIHLIRDPRDVVISYYHYSQGLPHLFFEPAPQGYTLSQFVDLFLRGRVWPGDIREHTASYASNQETDCSVIRYEALITEPAREYRRLLLAADVPLPEQVLPDLIAHTSFTNMRRLHKPDTARLGMVETNPHYILRSGVAGQHRKVLQGKASERLETELTGYIEHYGFG